MLIGSSDSLTSDAGKLRVTISDNEFDGTLERTPRVRFGQVHVYNNYYNQGANPAMQYGIGVGINSQVYDQNNYFQLPSNLKASDILKVYKGTKIHTEGDIVNGSAVNLLTAYNAANSPKLSANVGWTPTYFNTIVAASLVPTRVTNNAGTGHTLTEA